MVHNWRCDTNVEHAIRSRHRVSGTSTVFCTVWMVGTWCGTATQDTESLERPPSSVLSGWMVLGFATQLSHRPNHPNAESPEPPLSSVLSGWLVLTFATQLSHRPDHPNAESPEPPLSSVLSGWLVLTFATQLSHRPDHPNAEPPEPPLSSVLSGWLVHGSVETQVPHFSTRLGNKSMNWTSGPPKFSVLSCNFLNQKQLTLHLHRNVHNFHHSPLLDSFLWGQLHHSGQLALHRVQKSAFSSLSQRALSARGGHCFVGLKLA